jgi:hypothetical protein
VGQVINEFVLPKIEIWKVGKLVVADEFVERVCMVETDRQNQNNLKVVPLACFEGE